jgi:putative methyltransferase (TIGR04325 family)
MKEKSKEVLRALIPPAFLKLMRWVTYKIDVSRLSGVDGYLDFALSNLVIAKTKNFKTEIIRKKQIDISVTRLLVPFAFVPKAKTLKILDFGGGAGIQYEVAKLSFPNQKFHWVVVENVNLCESSALQTSPELEFRSTITEATSTNSHFDLVVASSSLQYTEDPIAYLQELCALRSPYLYITRQILNDDNEFFCFNQVTKLGDHGPGKTIFKFSNKKIMNKLVTVPVSIFEETIEKQYSILLRIKEEQDVHEFSRRPLNYFGYMCKLKP